jgi:hypothetical protein
VNRVVMQMLREQRSTTMHRLDGLPEYGLGGLSLRPNARQIQHHTLTFFLDSSQIPVIHGEYDPTVTAQNTVAITAWLCRIMLAF